MPSKRFWDTLNQKNQAYLFMKRRGLDSRNPEVLRRVREIIRWRMGYYDTTQTPVPLDPYETLPDKDDPPKTPSPEDSQ